MNQLWLFVNICESFFAHHSITPSYRARPVPPNTSSKCRSPTPEAARDSNMVQTQTQTQTKAINSQDKARCFQSKEPYRPAVIKIKLETTGRNHDFSWVTVKVSAGAMARGWNVLTNGGSQELEPTQDAAVVIYISKVVISFMLIDVNIQ